MDRFREVTDEAFHKASDGLRAGLTDATFKQNVRGRTAEPRRGGR